jgi:hypothetical protein
MESICFAIAASCWAPVTGPQTATTAASDKGRRNHHRQPHPRKAGSGARNRSEPERRRYKQDRSSGSR